MGNKFTVHCSKLKVSEKRRKERFNTEDTEIGRRGHGEFSEGLGKLV
jgi:hypothetical protein